MRAWKIITTVLLFPALVPFMASFVIAFHTPAYFSKVDTLLADTLHYNRSERDSFYKCNHRGKSIFCRLYGRLGTDSTIAKVNVRSFYRKYGDGMRYGLYKERYLSNGPDSEAVWRSPDGSLVRPRNSEVLDAAEIKKTRLLYLLVFHVPFWILLLVRLKLIPNLEKKRSLNKKV